MYIAVIKENGKVLTKIRCTKKEWGINIPEKIKEAINENDKMQTKIRSTKKERGIHIPEEVKEAINKLAIDTKKNRRYISFVLEGDYLNRDKSLLNGM